MDPNMEETQKPNPNANIDVPSIMRQVLEEFSRAEQARSEPAYKAELQEERNRREQLERRVNDLIEENKRSRKLADEAELGSVIRSELQRLGVSKLDLAYRAVKDDITRTEDGRLVAKTDCGEVGVKEYLSSFLTANPELLPPRISGGSGLPTVQKAVSGNNPTIDIERIRPGMTSDEMERVREEVLRVASQTLRG